MPRPIQPSAFSYLLPTLVQSGVNSQSSGASGWTPGGALSLQIPDNTRIGGNPRGLGAVDLQTQRTAATQVASGVGSFVAGVNNTVSGSYSAAMGSSNTVSGSYSAAMGSSNTVSGSNSFAIGDSNSVNGQYSTATGYGNGASSYSFATGYLSSAANSYSFATGYLSNAGGQYAVAMGQSCNANGAGSVAIGSSCSTNQLNAIALGNSSTSSSYATALGRASAGGQYATAVGQASTSGSYSFAAGWATASASVSVAFGYSIAREKGKFTHTGNYISASGDGATQTGILVLNGTTTDATPTVIVSQTLPADTTNQLILPNSSAFTFSILVVARRQAAGGTASAAWEIKGLIRREANAASTTLVNSATTVISNAPGWAVAVSADTTNGGLAVTVTGAAATNIRWVATVYTSEVIYA